MLNGISNIINKCVILGDDFNLFFHTSLKTQDGNPILKKTSLAKLIEIKENLDLCNIWRVRNPKFQRFTFHQNHVFGHIQRRLDYFLISNFLQQTAIRANVLASFYNDHFPVIFTIAFEWENICGNLINNEYTYKCKNHISQSLSILDQKGIKDDQIRWEHIKSEIRQFTIIFFFLKMCQIL